MRKEPSSSPGRPCTDHVSPVEDPALSKNAEWYVVCSTVEYGIRSMGCGVWSTMCLMDCILGQELTIHLLWVHIV